MTGSAFKRWTLCMGSGVLLYSKGGGLGEGGVPGAHSMEGLADFSRGPLDVHAHAHSSVFRAIFGLFLRFDGTAVLNPSLGRSWPLLGRSWAALGRSWRGLGAVLGRSWGGLWAVFGGLGRSWGGLGRSWGLLGRS